jgi:hypothetical protein
MRFLFCVTRHSAFVRISINTSQGFPYSAHNLLETRQFRPQLGEFFRLFREVILVPTNPMRQIAEFFVWHFGMALFRPRSGRSSRVLLMPNYQQIVIQNENYQRRQRDHQSRPRARAFQSRCQQHRKRELRHHVNGCETSRMCLRWWQNWKQSETDLEKFSAFLSRVA